MIHQYDYLQTLLCVQAIFAESTSGLPDGAIAGIVICPMLLLTLVAGGVVRWFVLRRRRERRSMPPGNYNSGNYIIGKCVICIR